MLELRNNDPLNELEMKRRSGLTLRLMLFILWVAVIVALALLLAGLVKPTHAHMAQTLWEYPEACCGGKDCRLVREGEVVWDVDGWWVKSTGDVIPFEKTRHSPDRQMHICINDQGSIVVPSDGEGPCLFTPEADG